MAAVYMVGIAKNHAMVDGNKRTALQVAVAFLRLNGFEVTLSPDPWHAHMLDVATGVLGVERVARLLAAEMGGDVEVEADP
jgi:death on curing protein